MSRCVPSRLPEELSFLKTSMSVSVSRAGFQTDDVQTSIRAHVGSGRSAYPVHVVVFVERTGCTDTASGSRARNCATAGEKGEKVSG